PAGIEPPVAQDQGLGQIVEQNVPAPLRLQGERKSRIRVDVDRVDRIHLDRDGERHDDLPFRFPSDISRGPWHDHRLGPTSRAPDRSARRRHTPPPAATAKTSRTGVTPRSDTSLTKRRDGNFNDDALAFCNA